MSANLSVDHGTIYFREAALLRWCLEYNRADFEFSEIGGRIVYLMDANIVRFFVRPEEETNHVTPFKSGQALDYAAATASITAEFLFSRNLAGQQNGPSFIAPAHGNEMSQIINAISEEARAQPTEIEPVSLAGANIINDLKTLVADFNDGSVNRKEAADTLKERMPELAQILMAGPFPQILALRRLYDDDLLRPLALHIEATREVLDPDRAKVKDWENKIGQERRPKNAQERQKVHNDAEALVQTMLLDEAAQDADASPTRYVMITADQHLLDAYTKWYFGRERPANARFVLRIPLQYTPILNSYEMPNYIENPHVTERAEKALDSLFANLQRADADYLNKLPFYRILAAEPGGSQRNLEALFGFNPLSLTDETYAKLSSVRLLWHDSFRAGVVLNARLMNRRRDEFDFLDAFLRDNVNLRQEIYDHQERSLKRIADAHTAFATRLNLTRLHADGALAIPQRAFPALREKFAALGDRSVPQILTDISAGDRDVLKSVDLLLSQEDSEAYFLAACIAHRCGNWSAAGIYSYRALELMPKEAGPDDASGEVSYLHATSIRYALAASHIGDSNRIAEVQRALKILVDAEKDCEASGDAFGMARALSERCSLAIMRLYYRWLSEMNSTIDEIVELRRFHDHMSRATALLRRNAVLSGEADEPLRRLNYQLHANVISAGVFTLVLKPGSPEGIALEAITRTSLNRSVEALRDSPLSLIMEAECVMASFACRRIDRGQALGNLRDLKTRVARESFLLTIDREEIAKFVGILNSYSGDYFDIQL